MTSSGEPADRDELRARYRAERDKRLRPEGNAQYREPTGRFAHLLEDPWCERVEREPVRDDVHVVVVGAGFGGLVTAARLRQAGVEDVRLVDGAGDVGGAWYWNRYPGAMCDTAAMVYLPLLEETGTVPSHKYVPAPEIHAHARRIAEVFGLRERALFSTQVTSLTWDDDAARWLVRTDRGDELRARFVATGTGPLHRPKLPGVPGLEDFAGAELSPATLQRAYENSDDDTMAAIRARVDEVVRDPATAAALKPWYRQLCKRPCFHDEYLQAFNRPNVHLVDTDGRGVERVDAGGVWAGGRHVELDCLVLATGFEVGTDHSRRAGFETVGRDGETLTGHWAEGMRTLHGIHVHGFPNLFVVGLAQGANLVSNVTHNLVEAGTTIAAVVAHADAVGATRVEVTAEAEERWVERIGRAGRGFLGSPECTPGYYNNEGGPIGRRERLNAGGDPDGPLAYFDHIERWRTSGRFEGLDVGGGTGRSPTQVGTRGPDG